MTMATDGEKLRIQLMELERRCAENGENIAMLQQAHLDLEERMDKTFSRILKFVLAGEPRHANSCSNQNVIDPIGAYIGVEACGCNRPIYIPTELPAVYPPLTEADLVAEIERMFNCRDGFYRSKAIEGSDDESFRYRTIGFVGYDPWKLRQALIERFRDIQSRCPSQRPILYWRFAKECRISEETEEGSPGGRRPTRYRIRTRVAVPEVVWTDELHTPEGGNFPQVS